MKWYLTTNDVNWADEFNLPFGELLNEVTYAKYKYVSDALESYTGYYGFGTNEDFEDFEFLGWEFVEISEEEANVLIKYNLPNAYTFVGTLFDRIQEDMLDNDLIHPEDFETKTYESYVYTSLKESFWEMPFHKFADYIDIYAKFLENGDE